MPETQPPVGREDSIDSQDPNVHPDKTKQKSRRPANTAFRQQRLKAWQPILTPKTVLPLFFAIGIIFAPIGGVLLWASAIVQEIVIDYSDCYTDAPELPNPATSMESHVTSRFSKNTKRPDFQPSAPTWSRHQVSQTFSGVTKNYTECILNFGIPNDMEPPVLFYYRLTNFYQNHRRYAKSFNTDQLSGTAVSAGSLRDGDCKPLATGVNKDNVTVPYYPCGLAANSQFNDTFSPPDLLNPPVEAGAPAANRTTYEMSRKGISWSSDKALYGKSNYEPADILPPPNWEERYPNGYVTKEDIPNLVDDEDFQVWMRLAGLPRFSKLAQRNDDKAMISGDYQVRIIHHFNVNEYGGTKAIVISTNTVMGGKNPFLGIAYIVVGGICILLGTLFTITHLIRPRKLGDHTYLSWSGDSTAGAQGASATTSGRDGVLAGESRA